MESNFREIDKNHLKSTLMDFYIEYDNNLLLPKSSKFGFEIEFKIPGYKSEFIDFITSNLNDDYVELSNYIGAFLKKIGYDFPWNVTYEMNEHLEVISPILTGVSCDWEMLKAVLSFLKDNGAYYSGACGAHIHVEKSILKNNRNAWINFLKLWYLFENAIIKFTNGENYFERKNFNTSSRRCSEEVLKLINNFDDDCKLPKKLYSKKNSLMLERKRVKELLQNVSGDYSVEDTIEFRCPNGTLNEVIWQNNTRFFLNLLNSSAEEKFDIEMLNYYMEEKNRTKDFLSNEELYLADFIFNKEYDKMCFLRQYYKDFNQPDEYSYTSISTPFWK